MGSTKNKVKYAIKTLEPGRIILHSRIDSGELLFCLCGDEKSDGFRRALKRTALYDENPLFAQIRYYFEDNETEFGKFLNRENMFDRYLFFLDFNELFNKKSELRKTFDFSKKKYTREELTLADTNVRLLFLFKNGFTIDYGDEERLYVPFESSASMARQCRITFVDSRLRDGLNDRLLLGMDLEGTGVKVKPHKFFSYKGNYMTDSVRVDLWDSVFGLNEKNILVLPDEMSTAGNESITLITASENKDRWDIKQSKNENAQVNVFDGEGIISPAFSREINARLKTAGASSFQIRMPFVKGMIHTVDFGGFFEEYCSADMQREYLVKDVFGIERDLSKAQLILTKSMFKCFEWLGEYARLNGGSDPMKLYFEGCNKYGHTLYIAKTDLSLHNDKTVKLNYQFLNTIGVSNSDFDKLIGNHKELIREIKNNKNKQRELLLGDKKRAGAEAWKAALARNINLLEKDKYIREKAQSLVEGLTRDICKGQIRVTGENRFLSGDLLGLLIHILRNHFETCGVDDDEVLANLKKERLRTERFYMPDAKIRLTGNTYCSFLRNPHLSKNEECALKPYVAKKGSLYDKYFGHLKGVVMTAVDSLAPATLGGADFDGDMVKIINDEIITAATLRDKKDYPEIVMIPSGCEQTNHVCAGVDYKHVKDSYGNRIGHISNMAIALGESIYFGGRKVSEFDDTGKHIYYTPADCTILTGLEIDAAKSGKHPTENIEEVQEQMKGKGSDYIELLVDLKRAFSGSTEGKSQTVNEKLTKESLSAGKPAFVFDCDGRQKTVEVRAKSSMEGIELPNIEKLPAYYLEFRYSEKTGRKKSDESMSSPFCFDNGKESEFLLMLYKAYTYYCRRFFVVNGIREKAKDHIWLSKAASVLRRQYDSLDRDTEGAGVTWVVFSNLCEEFERYFISDKAFRREELTETIERLKKSDWILTQKEYREGKLAEILPEDLCYLTRNRDYLSLLTDFDEGGYMLLYFILKDVADLRVERSVPEGKTCGEDIGTGELSGTEQGNLYIKAVNLLKPEFDVAYENRLGTGALKKVLLRKIKTLMKEYGIGFFEHAEYIYKKIGTTGSFFWDLLDTFDHGEGIVERLVSEESPYSKWEKDISEEWPFIEEYDIMEDGYFVCDETVDEDTWITGQ